MSTQESEPPSSWPPATRGPTVYWHYADESMSGGYRVQGYVTAEATALATVEATVAQLRAASPNYGEVKWSKLRRRKVPPMVTGLVDMFFTSSVACQLTFTCIVVHDTVDPTLGGSGLDKDLGFYKSHHLLMKHRFEPGSQNVILLDGRPSPQAAPAERLMECLNASGSQLTTPFSVTECRSVCSTTSPLIQLADLLCGAVAFSYAGRQSTCEAKHLLHDDLCHRLGRTDLRGDTGRQERKFRVWQYRPRATQVA